MNDQLEPLLRDTFDRLAEAAPAGGDLAARARARLRRRRQGLAGVAAATAVVVLAAGTVLWNEAGTVRPARPSGDTRVESERPTASPYCASGTDCPESRAIDALRRPLRLPSMPAGGTCPVSAVRTMPAGGGFNGPYPAVGEGPFRLTGDGHVPFEYPPGPDTGYQGTGWGGQKVIWSIDAGYSGPVLLRGARIDGDAELRFDRYLGALGQSAGNTAYPELAYPGNEGVTFVRTPPSAVRLQEPRCARQPGERQRDSVSDA
jgi:hypothetical protein